MTPSPKYPYYVVRTAMHGGGIIRRSRTEAAAEAYAERYRRGSCVCGCCAVIHIADLHHYDDEPMFAAPGDPCI